MRTFFDVCYQKAIKACPGKGQVILSLRVAMLSLSLHRTSVVRVSLFHHIHNTRDTPGQSLCQLVVTFGGGVTRIPDPSPQDPVLWRQ